MKVKIYTRSWAAKGRVCGLVVSIALDQRSASCSPWADPARSCLCKWLVCGARHKPIHFSSLSSAAFRTLTAELSSCWKYLLSAIVLEKVH